MFENLNTTLFLFIFNLTLTTKFYLHLYTHRLITLTYIHKHTYILAHIHTYVCIDLFKLNRNLRALRV